LPPLTAGAQVRVYNVPTGGYSSATVSFTNNGYYSATSSIFLVQ
jgi:hypothetical protein